MPHAADRLNFNWETLESPMYFWTLHWSEHSFWELAEMTLILAFQLILCFLCKSHKPNIPPSISTSKEDRDCIYVPNAFVIM